MRKLLLSRGFLVVVPCLVMTSFALGEEWTAEQKEVWEFEKSCWKTRDVEKGMACYHDDYVGWGASNPAPFNKADRRAFMLREYESSENVFLYLKPLSIQLHGNMAIVIYLSTQTVRDKATGEETTSTMRWTDVCLKEGSRWTWVADHGGPI